MMADKPKLCVDCKWMNRGGHPDFAVCNHPDAPSFCAVTGRKPFCSPLRRSKRWCGPKAKHFEQYVTPTNKLFYGDLFLVRRRWFDICGWFS